MQCGCVLFIRVDFHGEQVRTKGYSIFGRLLQRLHLRFLDSSQEAQFRAEFGKKTSAIGQLTLLSLAIVFGLFAFLEAWVLGLNQSSMPLLMFALASGMSVAIIPLNYIKEMAQIRMWLVSVTVLLGIAAIVTAIAALAKSLHLNIIAEGVETENQVSFLNSLDCFHVQGFLYSKPLNQDQLISFLNENKKLHRDKATRNHVPKK
ncbi:MAG: EAL domain-containing protein [Gammaproteobacteria bacterium]|nr:EAL domain-containing protein [Gammaproteobacteria bacterium]